jgi:hypothetical protein
MNLKPVKQIRLQDVWIKFLRLAGVVAWWSVRFRGSGRFWALPKFPKFWNETLSHFAFWVVLIFFGADIPCLLQSKSDSALSRVDTAGFAKPVRFRHAQAVQLGMDLRRGVWLKILASLHDEYIYIIFSIPELSIWRALKWFGTFCKTISNISNMLSFRYRLYRQPERNVESM